MRKKIFTLFIILFMCSGLKAQFTLDNCKIKARENYPLIQQYDLIEKTKQYNLSNAVKGLLPQLSLTAKATYQSEVTKVPVSIPGIKIEGLDKDQYAIALELNQVIWDGGVIHAQKELVKTSATENHKRLDVDFYAIDERINQLYFGILLFEAKLDQNKIFQEELQRNYTLISNYMKNGVANKNDLEIIKIEQLKSIQDKVKLELNKKAFKEILAYFIQEPIDEAATFIKPVDDYLSSTQINRPELSLFEAQNANLEEQIKMIKAANKPKLALFATGGYGRPGLNMLDNDFSPYAIGGVQFVWKIGNLYTKKNDIALITTKQHSVELQKNTFLFNTQMEVTQGENEIQKSRDLLKYDDEIIHLRGNVKKVAEIKVANGIFSVNDLIREINAEELAKQDKIQHEIELLQSIYKLKHTTNN